MLVRGIRPADPLPGDAESLEDDSLTAVTRAGVISGTVGFAARAISQLGTLALTIVATNNLAIADFGAFAIASAATFFCRNLLYVGAYEFLLKAPPSPTLRGSCFAANGAVAVMCAFGIVLLALAAPLIFGTPVVGELLMWLALSLFLVMFTSLFEAQLLRRQRLKHFYALTISGDLVGAVVGIAALLAGVGVMALVLQTYARLGTIFLAYLLSGSELSVGRADRPTIVEILRWSASRYASVVVNFCTVYGADFILGALLTPAAAGLYRASNRVVSAVSDLFAQPLLKIAQTNISARMARGEAPGKDWLAISRVVATFGWGALAGLAVLAGWLVPTLLGDKWAAAVPIVVMFCAAKAVSLLDGSVASLLVCADRQRFIFTVQSVSAVATLAAGFLLAPHGPFVVAIATSLVALATSTVLFGAAARLTAVSMRETVTALGGAGLPALGVVTAVAISGMLEPHGTSAFTHAAVEFGAGVVGGVAGLLVVGRSLLRSPTKMGLGMP